LVAQDSDHITHLIGPFRGDVRQKLQISGAPTYSKKSAASEYIGQDFTGAALSHRHDDIHK
jgi:hypothetical protein